MLKMSEICTTEYLCHDTYNIPELLPSTVLSRRPL